MDVHLPGNWTALMRAVSAAATSVVEVILEFEPDVNYDCGESLPVSCELKLWHATPHCVG